VAAQYKNLRETLPVELDSASSPGASGSILIISHEVVGKQMAGPGIRYFHLARVLSQEFDVVLAIPRPTDLVTTDFRTVEYEQGNWKSLEHLINASRVVILPSVVADDYSELIQIDVPIVIDGYDPLWAEWLWAGKSDPEKQKEHWLSWAERLTRQYLVGDFFICASERQRDWWLGLLEASGRINPWTFHQDPSLRRLIEVVPYGLTNTPPQSRRRVIRGVWQGIGEDDRIILWGGGLWPWLDPFTAIRAMGEVARYHQDAKLVFPGTRHPNPQMSDFPTHTDAARQLASQLGILNQCVFFGDWVPYEDWSGVLLESDVALTLHFDGLETRLAFRSRVLDYIWAQLPTVATRGDATSDLIAEYELGALVNCEDAHAVAEAILHLLDSPRRSFTERFERASRVLTWECAARPLIEFCHHPRRAPDKMEAGDQIGNPYYIAQLVRYRAEVERLQAEVSHWHAEVKAYERRRVVRLANKVHDIKESLRWR
jgi:glycosyltransferase involved in cell wall biosynthesis